MTATILIGTGLAALFALAVRSIINQRKKGGCCGSCDGCRGCSITGEKHIK